MRNPGILKTAGGRLELGSVAGPSLVSLTPIDKGWALGYEGVQNFREIKLSQQAAVDASGDIQVQGSQVTLTDGSQIETSTLRSEAGGTLSVNASDSVKLIGSSLITYTSGARASGDVRIATGNLIFRDGGGVTTSSGYSDYSDYATGAAGNVTITTRKLVISDGAGVSTGTAGQGKGGNLFVSASDSVELTGIKILSDTAEYNAGVRTEVKTEVLSSLNTSTFGAGAAGDLTIATRKLIIRDGAQVDASTFGHGKGGNTAVSG